MKMEIPSEAEYLMSFESSFRKHKAQLELIVTLYNGMHVTLLPVERPLLYERMLPIESLIENLAFNERRQKFTAAIIYFCFINLKM